MERCTPQLFIVKQTMSKIIQPHRIFVIIFETGVEMMILILLNQSHGIGFSSHEIEIEFE